MEPPAEQSPSQPRPCSLPSVPEADPRSVRRELPVAHWAMMSFQPPGTALCVLEAVWLSCQGQAELSLSPQCAQGMSQCPQPGVTLPWARHRRGNVNRERGWDHPPCSHTLSLCKPEKSHFQTHTPALRMNAVCSNYPQCCSWVLVEIEALYPTARRGHRGLGWVAEGRECLVGSASGQLCSRELLSLKWEQIYFFSR